tara:strand:+ start:280 stop:1173 length:894 start_codon:yes stop_codon:yes gene_type:complete
VKIFCIFVLIFSTKIYAFAGLEDLVKDLDKAVGEALNVEEQSTTNPDTEKAEQEKTTKETKDAKKEIKCPGVSAAYIPMIERGSITCKQAQNEEENLKKDKERREQARLDKEKKAAEKKAKKESYTLAKKKKRDSRGRWQFKFNMTFSEVKKIDSGCSGSADFFMCNIDGENTYLVFDYNPYRDKNDPDPFLNYFYKSYGEYNTSDFKKFVSKASKKYKLIKEPTSGEREKFITGKGDLIYHFKNESDDNSPLYISIRTQQNAFNKTIISAFYYEKNYFEETTLKKLNKDKKKFDDI